MAPVIVDGAEELSAERGHSIDVAQNPDRSVVARSQATCTKSGCTSVTCSRIISEDCWYPRVPGILRLLYSSPRSQRTLTQGVCPSARRCVADGSRMRFAAARCDLLRIITWRRLSPGRSLRPIEGFQVPASCSNSPRPPCRRPIAAGEARRVCPHLGAPAGEMPASPRCGNIDS